MQYIDPEQEQIQRSQDDLSLIQDQEQERLTAETIKKAEEQAVADARNKLIDFTDLQTFRPFQLFLTDIQSQIDSEFTAMESTNDPTILAKRTGAYCALCRIHKHVKSEITQASMFLKSQVNKP